MRISRSFLYLLSAIALACAVGTGPAVEQLASASPSDGKGAIRVYVTDGNGKAAVGVQVRLYVSTKHKKSGETSILVRIGRLRNGRSGQGSPTQFGTTNRDGVYTFANVPSGDYRVAAGVPGGNSTGQSKASVIAGQVTDVAISLEPAKKK